MVLVERKRISPISSLVFPLYISKAISFSLADNPQLEASSSIFSSMEDDGGDSWLSGFILHDFHIKTALSPLNKNQKITYTVLSYFIKSYSVL